MQLTIVIQTILKTWSKEFLDPRDGETHSIGKMVEQTCDESAEFSALLTMSGEASHRSFFQTDTIEFRSGELNQEKHEVDSS